MAGRVCVMFLAIALALAACGRGERSLTAEGAALYLGNCAVCHGGDASGGGGASVPGLSKTPPDLRVLALNAGGTFPAREVLAVLNGYHKGGQPGRRMAGFQSLESERRRRIKIGDVRLRPSEPMAALLLYLDSQQIR